MSNEYFDSMAAQWDDNPMRRELTKAVWNFIQNSVSLEEDMNVVDFGCGTGLLSVLLSEKVKTVYALDASVGMLGRLCEKIDVNKIRNIRTVHYDLSKDEPLNIKADVVVSSMALHHIKDTDDVIAVLSNYLCDGGSVVLTDLCSEDGSFHKDVEVFHNGFEPEEIEKKLQRNGLKIKANKMVYEIRKNDNVYPVFGICAVKE
ncbi:MAG: class I SAM-dependent methyltransferase [Sedimentisphaeraceae bacterium JB056]